MLNYLRKALLQDTIHSFTIYHVENKQLKSSTRYTFKIMPNNTFEILSESLHSKAKPEHITPSAFFNMLNRLGQTHYLLCKSTSFPFLKCDCLAEGTTLLVYD